MIEVIIKHEGQKFTGEMPGTWAELKVKHFIHLAEQKEEMTLVSLLTGIPLEALENTKADLSRVLIRVNELFKEIPQEMADLPRLPIEINGQQIEFPKSIKFTRWGQKSLVKNLINSDKEVIDIIPDVFAIYVQPLLDGKFDSNRIEEVKGLISEMPVIEVFPHVIFFFQKLKQMRNALPL
jgi:hypothetical protein